MGVLSFCLIFTFSPLNCVYSQNKTQQEGYKGVLTLWQIDTFEGGIGSRKQFLLNVSSKFEKENNGVLIMVISHTVESGKIALSNNEKPDMISFGVGFDVQGQRKLGIKTDMLGGKVGDKTYATPWCMGRYVLIVNNDLVKEKPAKNLESVIVSSGQFTLPCMALANSQITAKEIIELPPMESYIKFTSGKFPYMLGTQRDVIRLTNRNLNLSYIPLDGFNDLYQYICVCAENQMKTVYAEKFIKYLIGESCQKRLKGISMFSPYINVSYDVETLNTMEKEKEFSTISVFSSKELIEELKQNGKLALLGDNEALKKGQKCFLKP